jgi:2-amino-4-hydroxy-6-hydroxymethyldihydropteridine diphosphokinase
VQIGRVIKRSSVYETEPWGFHDPILFLNQALEIETALNPEDLLEQVHRIEESLGRVRPRSSFVPTSGNPQGCGIKYPTHYVSRRIDIDILFYGNRLIFTESLAIPPPRLHERRFTLIPLSEIAYNFMHPGIHKSIGELLAECLDERKVTML